MAFKLVALVALVASATAGVIPSDQTSYSSASADVKAAAVGYAAPYSGYGESGEYSQQAYYSAPTSAVVKVQPVLTKEVEEYDPHPQYKFGYDVQDTVSGDSKSQVETRDGDLVQGEYSLIDADGYKRTVQYTADSVHGFNAIVRREPINVAVKAVAAPIVVKYSALGGYEGAPPTQVAYTSHADYAAGPVVKGAYAATPIVKASPVAYPISGDH